MSVIVSISVSVTMRHFLFCRCPNIGYSDLELQRLPRQRMISIHINDFAANFDNRDQARALLGAQRCLHARFESLGILKVLFRHTLYLISFSEAIGLLRRDRDLELIPRYMPEQCFIQSVNDIALPLQQGDRIIVVGILQEHAGVVVQLVLNECNRILFDFHAT